MNESEQTGCGYQGYEFGATYPDSICVGGQLYDLDNCDDQGRLYEPNSYIACPECNHQEWLEMQTETIQELGWFAAEDGVARTACPFPQASTRYLKDGEWYEERWLKGYDEHSKG